MNAAQSDPTGKGALWRLTPEDDEDELEIFAGKTRLVESKRPSPSPVVSPPDPPPVHPENMVYDQTFKAPATISPPAPPPMPTLPGPNSLTPDGSWGYSSQGYPVPYSAQGHHPSHHQEYAAPGTYDRHHPQSTFPSHGWSQGAPRAPHPAPQTHAVSHSQHPPLPPQSMRVSSQHPHFTGEPTLSHYRQTSTQQQESYIRDRNGSQVFPTAPTFQGVQQTYVPPTELVNLGLASRESRLDERWASFMHESGYLDEINFRS